MSEPTRFTAKDLAREVLRLADQHPTATYEASVPGECLYAAGDAAGACGCLMGQAMRALGVTDDELTEMDANGEGITAQLTRLSIDWDTDIAFALDCAQTQQDHGYPWGQAVAPVREALNGNDDE